jgi:hypothetical protein
MTKQPRPSWPCRHRLVTRRRVTHSAPRYLLVSLLNKCSYPAWTHDVLNDLLSKYPNTVPYDDRVWPVVSDWPTLSDDTVAVVLVQMTEMLYPF